MRFVHLFISLTYKNKLCNKKKVQSNFVLSWVLLDLYVYQQRYLYRNCTFLPSESKINLLYGHIYGVRFPRKKCFIVLLSPDAPERLSKKKLPIFFFLARFTRSASTRLRYVSGWNRITKREFIFLFFARR